VTGVQTCALPISDDESDDDLDDESDDHDDHDDHDCADGEDAPVVDEAPREIPPVDCEKGITTPGNMTLRTVEDARAFGELYTSASKITIEGQELTNLDDLKCLESAFMIEMIDTAVERVDLPSLTDLHYLYVFDNPQLRVVSLPQAEVTTLRLYDNPQLSYFSMPTTEYVNAAIFRNDRLIEVDLRSLTEAKTLQLEDNPSLQSLHVPNLVEVDNYLSVTNAQIAGVLDLSSLETVGLHLSIQGNTGLSEIRFNSLREVGLGFYIDENSDLEKVGLDSLEWAGQDFRFRDNLSLKEVHLPSLTMMARNLEFTGNDSLTSVRVPLLQAVGNPDTSQYLQSSLSLDDNPRLSDVSFDSLVAVGRMLYIAYNDAITDLNGFSSLQFVRGQFRLENNLALRDMTGLYGLESVGMAVGVSGTPGHFIVRDNPRMPIEQAEALAYDIIGEDNIGGQIIIEDVFYGGGF
jgi:hypothetical protein